VELTQRVPVWLETVPSLLNHLKIKHVVLASHSCGAIYLLNTLYHLPHILSPTKPYVALLTPWVHPTHSHVSLMSLVEHIPNGAIAHWNQVIKGILRLATNVINPTIATSSGMFATMTSPFSSRTDISVEEEEKEIMEVFGMTLEELNKVTSLSQKCSFAEDTTGGNADAMLCLKKTGPGLWGACENYETFVPDLLQKLKSSGRSETRLKVQTYYAESDMMIGKEGQSYFERCWSSSAYASAIDFESMTDPGTNHDSICMPMNGVVRYLFEEAKESLD